jgi:predicted component of type VI protein secretion system
MTAQFQFVMRSGPTTGKIFPLEGDEIIVGRDATSGVAINDAEVSRKHARLSLQGSAYVIQDLGSTNGTFVNSQRIATTQVLNPGDTVSFGENIVLQYDVAFDPNATMVASPKTPVTAIPALKRASIPAPAPAPAQVPAPAPVYSGQVPVPPPPVAASPVKKGRSKVWIVLIIAVVLILCLCVVSPIIADALKMDCVIPFKWLFSIIGPMFGYGGCS